MSFQYFVYISDTKVDMLLQQIDPGRLRKHTGEVGVDLKLLKAKRAAETPAAAERIARLERVVRHLDDFGDVGDVDNPGQFFRGLLPMRWGPMVGRDGFPLAYFGGRTGKTVVGIGGSRSHLIGLPFPADQDAQSARSTLPALLQAFTPADEQAVVAASREDEDMLAELQRDEEAALSVVQRATTSLRGPAQNLEFLAKRLLYGRTVDGRSVLLGTPLYVAIAD